MYLRYAFVELARGKHPSNPAWFVTGANHAGLVELPDPWHSFVPDEGEQRKLLQLIASTPPRELLEAARFPDWLGHIGLALYLMQSLESKERIVTRGFVPQLLAVTPESETAARDLLARIVDDERWYLGWRDLGIVEHALSVWHRSGDSSEVTDT
jgi:hypothetical protein